VRGTDPARLAQDHTVREANWEGAGMSDQSSIGRSESIGVDQLTEAIASGVLRALGSQAAQDKPVDFAQLASDRGIFGQVVILCGIWPTGKEPPVIGGLPESLGNVGGVQGTSQ
jgi:hypothetical protein